MYPPVILEYFTTKSRCTTRDRRLRSVVIRHFKIKGETETSVRILVGSGEQDFIWCFKRSVWSLSVRTSNSGWRPYNRPSCTFIWWSAWWPIVKKTHMTYFRQYWWLQQSSLAVADTVLNESFENTMIKIVERHANLAPHQQFIFRKMLTKFVEGDSIATVVSSAMVCGRGRPQGSTKNFLTIVDTEWSLRIGMRIYWSACFIIAAEKSENVVSATR